MDETSLRRLLDQALAHEPPMGPVAHHSLAAGIRLRRRRRARNTTASLAAVAVIAAGVPAVIGALGHSAAGVRTGSHQVVIYVGSDHQDAVTPISAGASTAGRPIKTDPGPRRLAITPDGKTLYAANVQLAHGDADLHRHQHPREADHGRQGPRRHRGHAGRPDGLRRQRYLEHGDPDLDGHQHRGDPDPGRPPPRGHRYHPGREDRLRPGRQLRTLGRGAPDQHRHQHPGEADQGREHALRDGDDPGRADPLRGQRRLA